MEYKFPAKYKLSVLLQRSGFNLTTAPAPTVKYLRTSPYVFLNCGTWSFLSCRIQFTPNPSPGFVERVKLDPPPPSTQMGNPSCSSSADGPCLFSVPTTVGQPKSPVRGVHGVDGGSLCVSPRSRRLCIIGREGVAGVRVRCRLI
jgi:hypothetical protein